MMRLTFVLSGSHEGCLGTLGYGVFLEFAWRKSVFSQIASPSSCPYVAG